jgi:hypothetical protein
LGTAAAGDSCTAVDGYAAGRTADRAHAAAGEKVETTAGVGEAVASPELSLSEDVKRKRRLMTLRSPYRYGIR